MAAASSASSQCSSSSLPSLPSSPLFIPRGRDNIIRDGTSSSLLLLKRSHRQQRQHLQEQRRRRLILILGAIRRGGGDNSNDGGGAGGSYHGNYVFQTAATTVNDGGKNADDNSRILSSSAAEAATHRHDGNVNDAASKTTATHFIGEAALSPLSPVPPPTAAATNSKLTNLQERTGPAILMLSALSLIIKFTGKGGVIGLVYILQGIMYYESTTLVERYHSTTTDAATNYAAAAAASTMTAMLKWWWFLTAIMMTSGSKLLSNYYYDFYSATSSIMNTQQQMNFITFGMCSISLIIIVVQLALVKIVVPPPSSSLSSSNNTNTNTAETTATAAATTSIVKVEDVYRAHLTQVTSCHISLLLLIGSSSYWISTVSEYGILWVLYPALLVIVNDTMAYFFGVLFGQRKLLPHLSPKKTVEGFLGAGLSTLAASIPLLKLMSSRRSGVKVEDVLGVNNLGRHAFILAMYISLVSPFGGFFASAVKRAYGAKDFGSLIPGHGGVIDRLDCQIVTAPFVFLYLNNFFTTTDSNP